MGFKNCIIQCKVNNNECDYHCLLCPCSTKGLSPDPVPDPYRGQSVTKKGKMGGTTESLGLSSDWPEEAPGGPRLVWD